jgi:hypothetical protein
MNRIARFLTFGVGLWGGIAACDENLPPPATQVQPVVPGTQSAAGVTEEQVISDEDVVHRLASARCDRSQSCNGIGPGAEYRDRVDCVAKQEGIVRRDIGAAKCPAGIGAVGFSQCVRSVEEGTCDQPGMVYGATSHCTVGSLCMKVRVQPPPGPP